MTEKLMVAMLGDTQVPGIVVASDVGEARGVTRKVATIIKWEIEDGWEKAVLGRRVQCT